MITTLFPIKETDSLNMRYFKTRLYNCKTLITMTFIFNMLGLPLFFLLNLGDFNSNTSLIFGSIILVISLALAVLLGYFIAVSVFKHLYDKSITDMEYSLPVTRKSRFWLSYSAGLAAYIVPFIIGGVIGFVLYKLSYLSDSVSSRINGMDPMIYGLIVALVAMILFYTLTVLIATCCASLVETTIYTLLTNAMIPLTIVSLGYYALHNSYGFDDYSIFNTIGFSSPIGIVVNALSTLDSLGGILTIPNLIPILLFTAAVLVTAYFLYTMRKAEHVGRPFVFKMLYYVISASIMLALTPLFAYDGSDGMILFLVIITFIIFFIMEVISNRGFKQFWKGIIRYVCTLAGSALIVFVFGNTRGFGYEYRVPSVGSVASVELYSPSTMILENHSSSYSNVTFTSKESKQAVIDIHKMLIDNKLNDLNEYNYKNQTYIKIKYNLRSGNTVYRRYNTNITEETLDSLYNLMITDDYKKYKLENFKEEVYRTNYYQAGMPESRKTTAKIEALDSVTILSEQDVMSNELMAAIKKDIMAETYEQLFYPEKQPAAILLFETIIYYDMQNHFTSNYEFIIKGHYENTINYLNEKGMGALLFKDFANLLNPPSVSIRVSEYNNNRDIYVFSGNRYGYYEYDLGYYSMSGYVAKTSHEKVKELLKVVQPVYMFRGQTPICIELYSDGTQYCVPPQYESLVYEILQDPDALETNNLFLEDLPMEDYNRDGFIDDADIEFIKEVIFDINGDGVIDGNDALEYYKMHYDQPRAGG